jgi:hypothetical protein
MATIDILASKKYTIACAQKLLCIILIGLQKKIFSTKSGRNLKNIVIITLAPGLLQSIFANKGRPSMCSCKIQGQPEIALRCNVIMSKAKLPTGKMSTSK